MDRHYEATDNDETGIQGEGNVQAERPLAKRRAGGRRQDRIRGRDACAPLLRSWMRLIPWLALLSMHLGFAAVLLQFATCNIARGKTTPFLVALTTEDRDLFLLASLLAAGAIAFGAPGYWLWRRAIAYIEKELIYPRGTPATIGSKLWFEMSIACGLLALIPTIIVLIFG
jgi:hypothetical protein